MLLQPQLLVVLILRAAAASAVGGAARAGGAAAVGRVLPVLPVVGLPVEERPQLADAPVDLALDDRVSAVAAVLGRPSPGGAGGGGGGGGHAGGHAVRRLQLPPRRRGPHLKISVQGLVTVFMGNQSGIKEKHFLATVSRSQLSSMLTSDYIATN